jgi:exosome complex component RRP41
MPIAMTPEGQITLLQMDGRMSKDEFHVALEMAMKGCRDIYEIQRKALVDKYSQLESMPVAEVEACE